MSEWLQRPDRQREPGAWYRLRSLRLGLEVDLGELTSILRFSNAVTAKPVVHGAEDERGPVARALLAAAGWMPSAERAAEDAPVIVELAALSRALSPADNRATAQPELLAPQVDLLSKLAHRTIPEAEPFTLLPPVGDLPREGRELLTRTMRHLRSMSHNGAGESSVQA